MDPAHYPQTPDERRLAFQVGLGIIYPELDKAYQDGIFPYEELASWIKDHYQVGYSPEFVPALLRNLPGLVEWVYGDGSEPNWRGSDEMEPRQIR